MRRAPTQVLRSDDLTAPYDFTAEELLAQHDPSAASALGRKVSIYNSC